MAGVDGGPDAEVEAEAEPVDPQLVLGPDLAVLDDAEAGADRPEDEDEAEEDAGAEGRVVKLGGVLGGEGQAEMFGPNYYFSSKDYVNSALSLLIYFSKYRRQCARESRNLGSILGK